MFFRFPSTRCSAIGALLIIFLSAATAVGIYAVRGDISYQQPGFPTLSPAATRHLSGLLAAYFLVKAAGYILDRYDLMTSNNGVVFGAAYTDVHLRLPLLIALAGAALVGSLMYFQYLACRYPLTGFGCGHCFRSVDRGNDRTQSVYDEAIAKKLNSAVFPGMQGGPLMHVIAAKAVAFGEALRPSFKLYAKNVVENAKALAATLKARGLDIVSGGTDTHLMLVDLRPKRLTGKVAEAALGRAHITCNKNGIPFDPEKPTVTSGVRLGTPAGTTRGFGVAEFQQVGEMISDVLDVLAQKGVEEDALIEASVRDRVKRLIDRFPIYDA